MTLYKVGDKVAIDDDSGIIEAIKMTDKGPRYDIQYSSLWIMAVDVPEEEIGLWTEDKNEFADSEQ
jgi:hypothetical protein